MHLAAFVTLVLFANRYAPMFPVHWLQTVLHDYGYAAVGVGLLLESMGMPLPGESLMIGAAIYAATTHRLDIYILVPVAAAGAICGDQFGYLIGRWIGFRALSRWGGRIGLREERLMLGRFLFRRYGGRVVFLGRFVAVLRTFVAVLAGANRMPWHGFLLWNALGGVVWTSLYGFGAYALGDAAKQVSGPVGIALGVVIGAALLAALVFVKRNEARLMDEARRQMGQTAVGAARANSRDAEARRPV
jgi:membrane protein DedA with SNARE-associated domain